MRMKALSDHPLVMAVTGFGGLGVSTIQSLTAYVQFGIAVFSLVLVGLTIFLKVREIIRGSLK
jgi:D-arabinose 1-dehydrogenase-like Zn-dependent alcohol dehydrogenase